MALLMGAIGGMRNFEDSKRKSAAVKDGMRRKRERDGYGGRVTDGYRVEDSRPVRDTDREPTVKRLFELGLSLLPPYPIARTLNDEGHRTKKEHLWRAKDVKRILSNPFYATASEPYVTPAQHETLRAHYSRPVSKKETGRQATTHLLSRLAVCPHGYPYHARTDKYVRKDGTTKRYYAPASSERPGSCDCKAVDAEAVGRGGYAVAARASDRF